MLRTATFFQSSSQQPLQAKWRTPAVFASSIACLRLPWNLRSCSKTMSICPARSNICATEVSRYRRSEIIEYDYQHISICSTIILPEDGDANRTVGSPRSSGTQQARFRSGSPRVGSNGSPQRSSSGRDVDHLPFSPTLPYSFSCICIGTVMTNACNLTQITIDLIKCFLFGGPLGDERCTPLVCTTVERRSSALFMLLIYASMS